MKPAILLLTFLSLNAFAQSDDLKASRGHGLMSYQQAEIEESQDIQAAFKENPCVNGRRTFRSLTGIYNREYIEGVEHVGVTSRGDVAILKNNRFLLLWECSSSLGMNMAGWGQIQTEDASGNCSSGSIVAFSMFKPDGRALNFRSPSYTENSSFCKAQSSSVSNSERSVLKEVDLYPDSRVSGSAVNKL